MKRSLATQRLKSNIVATEGAVCKFDLNQMNQIKFGLFKIIQSQGFSFLLNPDRSKDIKLEVLPYYTAKPFPCLRKSCFCGEQFFQVGIQLY